MLLGYFPLDICLVFADELIVDLTRLIVKFECSLNLALLLEVKVRDFNSSVTLLFQELLQVFISLC